MPLRYLYIDMNSYFASVEQQLDPRLRGKPVAVVPVFADTTSCIAASYEAKAFGVKTGTRVGDARVMCPGLILVTGKTRAYITMHHQIIEAIDTVLPVTGVHSIDEFSCKLVREERNEAAAKEIALRMKRAIASRVGEFVKCSIGAAPNRLLAKVAADMNKPDGFTCLSPEDLPQKLWTLQLIDLPGIGPKMNLRLQRAGITSMFQLTDLSEVQMHRLWQSVLGREWYYRLRGEELFDQPTTRRTIGHSHVLSPEKRVEDKARAVAVRLLSKVSARARSLRYVAEHLTLTVRYQTPGGWNRRRAWGNASAGRTQRGAGGDAAYAGTGGNQSVDGLFAEDPRGAPSNQTPDSWSVRAPLGGINDIVSLLRAFAPLWDAKPSGKVLQISVTLHDLASAKSATGQLFGRPTADARLSAALDKINSKYGVDTLYPGSMHGAKDSAPRRIAFGNIPDLATPDVEEG